jgi:biotin synthase-like enzyme
VKRKIYLIHPSFRDRNGQLLKGKKLYVVSLALPALCGAIPDTWEKETCLEFFEDVNFDTDASVVGISSMGYEIFRGVELAAEFRKRGKIVIFGGFQPHISREFIDPHADAVIHGNPGPAAMTAILGDIENHRLQRDYYCKPELNFRFDYSRIDLRRSFFAPVLFGVGCRNACDYCCIGSIFKGRYALRKASHVLEELELLRKKTRRMAVVDTNVYNNRGYLQYICREMICRKFDFVWGAQCTIDIGNDPETLALMADAGCRVLFIGMESIEQVNLDALHKRYQVTDYPRMIKTIHDAGIRIAAFFMYGLDGDTLQTAARMSAFIDQHDIALPMINILVPTPATPMFDRLKAEHRILIDESVDFLRNNIAYNSSFCLCYYIPKHMTPEQVEDGFIDLLGRLSGFRQIIRRSVGKGITLSLFLLYMNWLFRREYIRLRKLRKHA